MNNLTKPFYFLSLLAAFLLVFSSCSDDDENAPKGIDSKLLIGKQWRMAGYTYNGANEFTDWENCEKDDIWIFRDNKEFEWNEGATKCEPADAQVVFSGMWNVQENRFFIDNEELGLIEELSSSTLRVKFTDDTDVEVFSFIAQ